MKKHRQKMRMAVLTLVAVVVAIEGFLIANTAAQPNTTFVAGVWSAFAQRTHTFPQK